VDLSPYVEAISRVQGMIEFSLDGTVLTSNENILKTVEYELDEIKGQHHRMFYDPAYTSTDEYAAFWQKLNRGEFDAGVYRRVGIERRMDGRPGHEDDASTHVHINRSCQDGKERYRWHSSQRSWRRWIYQPTAKP
jgi:PAS domain-containing protein